MKQTLSLNRVLITLLFLAVTTITLAYDFSVNGIYYNKNSDGTSVTVTYESINSCGCKVNNVVIPSTVTYNGKTYKVTSIGSQAFHDSYILTSITIPESVTSIGSQAFQYCANLASITIPESVTRVGSKAFYGTAWYKNKSNGLVYADKVAYEYKGTMPSGTKIVIKGGTLVIADNAFYGCSGLTSVTIPESVTSIGSDAFSGCSGLTSITIPNSVTSIGGAAFSKCSNLTSVTIPNSVTDIGYAAFMYCSSLTSVTIGNNVTSIGYNAFCYCSSLTLVTIGSSVTNIDYGTFSYCSGLKEVHCLAEQVPTTHSDVFSQTDVASATLYVPASVVDDYKSAAPWSGFGTIVGIEPEYILGDANGNGVVEIGDVTSILTLMATPEAPGYDTKAADANKNGVIEIGDVTTILTIMASGN